MKNNNLVISTFGNVSLADRNEEIIAIKPSGIPYDSLSANDIVILDFKGNIVEGKRNPWPQEALR